MLNVLNRIRIFGRDRKVSLHLRYDSVRFESRWFLGNFSLLLGHGGSSLYRSVLILVTMFFLVITFQPAHSFHDLFNKLVSEHGSSFRRTHRSHFRGVVVNLYQRPIEQVMLNIELF